MNRREMMIATGAALGLSRFPLGYAAAPSGKKRRVLFLTKSGGFEHPVVKREGGKLSFAERVLTDLGKKHNFEVTCTKNGSVVLADDFEKYDVLALYTSGDLTGPSSEEQGGGDGMTARGKARMLELIRGGMGVVGFHAATDSFHSKGKQWENQAKPDPFIAMLGGEFVSHGKQQVARMTVTSPRFPGVEKSGKGFDMFEEWYSQKNFARDLHVILREEAYGMEGQDYMRPAFPATWARMHGKGRVFYTSMGHLENVWTGEMFQAITLGGLAWAARNVDADVTPNIKAVTPYAHVLPAPKK